MQIIYIYILIGLAAVLVSTRAGWIYTLTVMISWPILIPMLGFKKLIKHIGKRKYTTVQQESKTRMGLEKPIGTPFINSGLCLEIAPPNKKRMRVSMTKVYWRVTCMSKRQLEQIFDQYYDREKEIVKYGYTKDKH